MATVRKSITDVSGWRLAGVEPTGLDPKLWLIDPADKWPWLFKPVPVLETALSGEDWAEVIAADVAGFIGVPHAEARLAIRDGHRGCIVRKFMERGWEFQHGSSLLSEVVPDFDPQHPDRSGHTVVNIDRVLGPLSPPVAPDIPPELSAFGTFAGYLIFDALIANQDRHSNNWGVLRPPPGLGSDTLAPSFDHGSSLGFNVPEAERERRLAKGSVAEWARKGWARQFERPRGSPRVLLRDLADAALTRAGNVAQRHWQERVAAIDPPVVEAAASSVPGLSDVTASFVTQVILANRELILEHS
ncbi:MAG: HipA domain-containing protein [Actinobacteria bacterium]|nr:HipA domain-containing protein [Actinomycetota bacterium]